MALGTMACVSLACTAAGIGTGVSDGTLTLGTWGGENAAMIVSDTAMHLHIGCTYGDVSGRIVVDADGTFAASGSYMLHAYPVQYGPTVPARFVGRVQGATATITVTVTDTVAQQTVVKGPVVVTLGEAPRLGPCPICRRPILTRPVRGVSANLSQ